MSLLLLRLLSLSAYVDQALLHRFPFCYSQYCNDDVEVGSEIGSRCRRAQKTCSTGIRYAVASALRPSEGSRPNIVLQGDMQCEIYCVFVILVFVPFCRTDLNKYRSDCILAHVVSLALQGELARARINELESQLAPAAKDNEKLRDKLEDVVTGRNSLHEEVMMHSDGGLAVLSGEVTTRRRCRP